MSNELYIYQTQEEFTEGDHCKMYILTPQMKLAFSDITIKENSSESGITKIYSLKISYLYENVELLFEDENSHQIWFDKIEAASRAFKIEEQYMVHCV